MGRRLIILGQSPRVDQGRSPEEDVQCLQQRCNGRCMFLNPETQSGAHLRLSTSSSSSSDDSTTTGFFFAAGRLGRGAAAADGAVAVPALLSTLRSPMPPVAATAAARFQRPLLG